MPSLQAWQREAERYQRIADGRREREYLRRYIRRQQWGLVRDSLMALVLVAAAVGWALWLVGVFR